MPTDLLSLPPEVHRSIFDLLNYGDLVRLRKTCRILYQIDARDILEEALLQLEDDCAEARMIFDDSERDEAVSFYEYDDGPDTETWGTLVDRSIQGEELRGLLRSVPCYSCVRLRPLKDHFYHQNMYQVAKASAVQARLQHERPCAEPSRQCVECLLQSPSYLHTPGGRWVCVEREGREGGYRGNNHYWLVVCRLCSEEKFTTKKPGDRQRLTDLCTRRYHASHPEWSDFYNGLIRERNEARQHIAELQSKDKVLSEYIQWMDNVDNGKGLREHGRPSDPENTKMPQWEEIRADAIEKLPGYTDPREFW